MDYELHGQGLTMRAGNYPALTVMNHFMMRKDMRRPTIPESYGLAIEQRAFHRSGARPRRTKTSGYYKRRPKTGGYYKRRRRTYGRRY